MQGIQRTVMEWGFISERQRENPFAEVMLDVIVEHESGENWCVPAFWHGEMEWKVRFAPPLSGKYLWRSVCSDTDDTGLHHIRGELRVAPYQGDNPFFKHGAIRQDPGRRHFVHDDGKPFLWLGDTWWMALTSRLRWPDDFKTLAADRVAKGFNVIQIVAGLYPDMYWRDPRGANEAGFPYDDEFIQINSAYFDNADTRIEYLVDSGLMPCIVGCWGYFLKWMGVEKLKRHWRYLIARWSAYPVAWCLCGEGKMPYYLSETKDQDAKNQQEGWTEIGRYVRKTDPMHRLVTIHPTDKGRDQVTDESVLDFEMLQTGHSGYDSIPNTIRIVTEEYSRTPVRPIVNAEVDYEGFMHGNDADVQRMAFWGCMLSGAGGHTYGANGIWQVNTREQPYGPSPHGNNWGNRPWDEAMHLPGSGQLGKARTLLERFQWLGFEPHQEWIQPAATPDRAWQPYAAGIPRVVRIIYIWFCWGNGITVLDIEEDISYRGYFWDPVSGEEHELGIIKPDTNGSWQVPILPELRDWILVMETESGRKVL